LLSLCGRFQAGKGELQLSDKEGVEKHRGRELGTSEVRASRRLPRKEALDLPPYRPNYVQL